jgi:hypothetical protein
MAALKVSWRQNKYENGLNIKFYVNNYDVL